MRLSTSSSTRSMREGTPGSRSTTPDGTQKNFPTRTEWESWKETIRELYIERNMTLARLRDHMAQVHGFVAEDHEYKRRLAQWRFRKNYTSAEKDAVAMHLDNFRAQQQPVVESQFRLNDRPLRMDKIERHRKAARRKSSKTIALQLNQDPSQESEVTMSTFGGDSEPDIEEHLNPQLGSVPVPQYTFPMDQTEAMMWNTSQYDQSRGQDGMLATSMAIDEQDRVLVVVFNIVKAVHIFGAGDSQTAVQTLDECCDSVKILLQTDTWNFIMYMTVLQTLPAWNQAHCHHLYRYMYGFFARMSYQVLGHRHPVTNYLGMASDFDSRSSALVKACLLVLELGAQQFAMAQTRVKYSGGIPIHSEGGLDFRLLGSEGLGAVSSSMAGRQQQRPALDANLNEMVRLLKEGWYSHDLADAAEVMSALKKSIESYARRLVGSLSMSSSTNVGSSSDLMQQQDIWQSPSMSMATMHDQGYLDTNTAAVSMADAPSMSIMSTSNVNSTNYPPTSRAMMNMNLPRRKTG